MYFRFSSYVFRLHRMYFHLRTLKFWTEEQDLDIRTKDHKLFYLIMFFCSYV